MTAFFGQVVTAMVTPFDTAGEVDYAEAERLAHYLVDHGTDTVLLAGTTGESPTLTHHEEFELFRVMVSSLRGRAKVMAGTGSNATLTAISSTQEAAKIGVDGVLQVVPYYNKPSQEGLYRHFEAIAAQSDLPIMLYNVPGRTGTNMLPETTARLAVLDSIVAIKEASGSIEQVAQIHQLAGDQIQIYSGDDGLTYPFMEKGACGVVSVASHLVGDQIQTMITHFQQGNRQAALAISDKLSPLYDVLFITSNPVPLKCALRERGFQVGGVRLPLVDVTDPEKEKILSVLSSLGLENVVSVNESRREDS